LLSFGKRSLSSRFISKNIKIKIYRRVILLVALRGSENCNGRIIADAIEKANTLNSYYSTVFSSEGNFLHIQGENRGDPFTTDIKTIS